MRLLPGILVFGISLLAGGCSRYALRPGDEDPNPSGTTEQTSPQTGQPGVPEEPPFYTAGAVLDNPTSSGPLPAMPEPGPRAFRYRVAAWWKNAIGVTSRVLTLTGVFTGLFILHGLAGLAH
jgi:hypothetical protein